MARKLNRRTFLRLSSIAAAGVVAAACGPQPTAEVVAPTKAEPVEQPEVPEVSEPTATVAVQEEVQPTPEAAAKVGEPPLFADRVASGELPPLDQRLPVNPVVVSEGKDLGVYGGELRMIHFDTTWFVSNYGLNAERMLHYSDQDLKTIVPNVFESWEVSDDGKNYTIHLRKGMKWSDGAPVTSEDVRFWWEDVLNNPDLSGGVAYQYRMGGELMKLTYPDDFTITVTFAVPFGNFPAHLTRWHIGDWLIPSHYLKKFHAKYTDINELNQQAVDTKLESWTNLFWRYNDWGMTVWQGPEHALDYPSISPWIIIDNPQEGLYIWERNPYYWKVDAAGNQLPYIDTMRYDYVLNVEAVKLKIIQADIDYVGPHDVSIADYPLYKENEEKGKYVVADLLSCMTDRYVLFPQHYQTDDPVLTDIINHPNFVKALSVAIDREEINESLYYGLAKMGPLTVMPNSKYYKPEYGEAYSKFDKDLANKLLDEMGLDKRDGEGIRLRSDGQPLKFNIEHAGQRVGTSTAAFTELVTSYWRDIGIAATTKEEQENLYKERMHNGHVHCGVWHADASTDMLWPIEPHWFIPTNTAGSGTASTRWSVWYNAADKSAPGLTEPPDYIKELYGLFDQMTSVVDENERVKLGQKILDWLAETPLAIGTVAESPAPILFNKNLRNLPPAKAPIGWDTYGISTYHPESLFYEGGQRA